MYKQPCVLLSKAQARIQPLMASVQPCSQAISSLPQPGRGTTMAIKPKLMVASRWFGSMGSISHLFVPLVPDFPKTTPSQCNPFRGLKAIVTCVTATTCCRRSEEHTSELQSRGHLVCRLL